MSKNERRKSCKWFQTELKESTVTAKKRNEWNSYYQREEEKGRWGMVRKGKREREGATMTVMSLRLRRAWSWIEGGTVLHK